MTATAERIRTTSPTPELRSFEGIMAHVPDAVGMAKMEAESSRLATTPEGTFALTYLLATRNLLRPVLSADLAAQTTDLFTPVGGQEYNPERNIDAVGTAIALVLAKQTNDIPHFWMRTEESARWESIGYNGSAVEDGENFAVIDPLDMTSSIAKKYRVQTTGIAIYDKKGEIKTVGIMSLVDDDFLFIERVNNEYRVFPPVPEQQKYAQGDHEPLRIAAKTRRMYTLKDLPLMTQGNLWSMDCDSGYAVLGVHRGTIDTIVDHVKGNPWYEVVIWIRAAQILGYTVSDPNGNPIDISHVIRRVIRKHEGDNYRIPFIVSRTPEIHAKVLDLLKPTPQK